MKSRLAAYLERSDTPSALTESPRHRLADLIYCLVAGLEESMQTSLRNYTRAFLRTHAASTKLAVPGVVQLLADPAFRPLDQWFRQRQVNLDDLQSAVDKSLEQARQAAIAQKQINGARFPCRHSREGERPPRVRDQPELSQQPFSLGVFPNARLAARSCSPGIPWGKGPGRL